MTENSPPETTCWALSEGHAGMMNQAIGLAEALGVDPAIKRLWPRAPWKHLPPRLWFSALKSPGPGGDALDPPWPDILISCGKRAAAPAIAVRRASGGKTFLVNVQNPPVSSTNFDLVVVPRHDRLRGDNVFVTEAAVHHVTSGRLASAVNRMGAAYAHLPQPRIAVLIGGSNKRYRLTPEITRQVAGQLADISRSTGAGLLVTPSRRTGAENVRMLHEMLEDVPAAIWNGDGDNPYFAFLGLADTVLVTCDSVSMTSEAASTGKPVYVIELEGRSRRIGQFHAHMREMGITRPFRGVLEKWTYDPLDDTARAAAEIRSRMQVRG